MLLSWIVVTAVSSLFSAASGRSFAKKWWCLGPFASGKVEYDGDPLVPRGGLWKLYQEGPGAGAASAGRSVPWHTFLAEHVTGGYVSWISMEGSNHEGWMHVQIPHAHVAFQTLMQSPPKGGSADVLHVQYGVVGSFKVKEPGGYHVNCRGLHTFHLWSPSGDPMGPFAGNIYSDAFWSTPVQLEVAGRYRLLSRVRGKVPLQFSCKVDLVKDMLKSSVKKSNLPDVVQGRFLVDPAPLDLRVVNTGAYWLHVTAHVTSEKMSGMSDAGASDTIRLAPGMVAQLPVMLSLQPREGAVEEEKQACVKVEVLIEATMSDKPGHVVERSRHSVLLRCRRRDQSARFTYRDVDGSVAVAAVLHPRGQLHHGQGNKSTKLPVVVSLSGVGVEPQQQADAYKMKMSKDQEDYLFGFDDLWVLAPQRDGPHNWEDVGLRSVLRAIEILAQHLHLETRDGAIVGADANRLVIHGHSRGGHGAWALASRIPDRTLGVASACGWYSREEYGDANNLWVHETSLMHMDKMLLGVFHASIAMNDNALHASNLKGLPALVRVASKDKAVPPWFGRRMARHLQEEGVNVTFEEFDQEHWWWDTKKPNDGGVMHDASMRDWTLWAAFQRSATSSLMEVLRGGQSLVISAASSQYLGRFGLRLLQRRSPAARGFVKVTSINTSSPSRSSKRLRLMTSNVQRFSWAKRELAKVAKEFEASADFSADKRGSLGLLVDSQELQVNEEDLKDDADGDALHFCRGNEEDSPDPWGTAPSSPSRGAQAAPWRRCWPWRDGDGGDAFAARGPIREVFGAPWAVVIPDEPSSLEVRLASYFATGHLVAVGTATQVLRWSDLEGEDGVKDAALRGLRLVHLGRLERLRVDEKWPVELRPEGTLTGGTFHHPGAMHMAAGSWRGVSNAGCQRHGFGGHRHG